jgi:lantibiotic transport system permease protein
MPEHSPRFATVVAVELIKLRRSLALLLAVVAPSLVAVFVFFNLLRMEKANDWSMTLMSSAAIWAFFMLPMSVTALTALVAHAEHGPRTWDHLRALPVPAWQFFAAKLLGVLGVVLLMTVLLAAMTPAVAFAAGWLKPTIAPTGDVDLLAYVILLGRMTVAAGLLVVVQAWVALRFASFVPALATGIGGTFFAVVATSAKAGVALPWQIPVNQLAADPARADLALAIGGLGGVGAAIAMVWHLSRRDVL